MLFKDFSEKILFLALVAILFGVEEPLCNFGRRHLGEHSCEIILNLDQRFMRCHLKIFLENSIFYICSSSGHFTCWSISVCAILVDGIMGNLYVKLEGSGELKI